MHQENKNLDEKTSLYEFKLKLSSTTNLEWKPGACNHSIAISSACMSWCCWKVCSTIALKQPTKYRFIGKDNYSSSIGNQTNISYKCNTPVARIVEAAWNLCNVPSSIFNAITPWQLPEYQISIKYQYLTHAACRHKIQIQYLCIQKIWACNNKHWK